MRLSITRRLTTFGALVALLAIMTHTASAISPERQAMDAFVQRMRQAKTQSVVSSFNLPGRDIDDAIDAFVDVIAHYEGRDRANAAWYMVMGIGMTPSEPLTDPRRLDYMLPARVAPVLAAALREESRAGRGHLTQLLGSIDEPTKEVIDTLRALLLSDDPDAQDDAAEGIGMLGRHGAALAPDLEWLLASMTSTEDGQESAPQYRRVRVAGALARVSDTVRPEVLDVLIEGLDGASSWAIRQLVDLGERGLPAVPALLEHLPKELNDHGTIVEAVLFASPDALPELLTTLVDIAAVDEEDIQDAIDAEEERGMAARQRAQGQQQEFRVPPPQDLTEEQQARNEKQRKLIAERQRKIAEPQLVRTSKMADGVLSALLPALVWAQAPQDSRGPMPQRLHRMAGPLEQIPDDAIAAASRALAEIASSGDAAAATRAVECLADMGPMAAPALDQLLAIYRRGDASDPPVGSAMLSISQDMEAEILPGVLTRAISDDAAVAASAQEELSALAANADLKWEDTPQLRAIAAQIIEAVEARPASEGKALARALRRIDTPEARKAYRAHTRRALREKSRRR
jgi:hypothetical protein